MNKIWFGTPMVLALLFSTFAGEVRSQGGIFLPYGGGQSLNEGSGPMEGGAAPVGRQTLSGWILRPGTDPEPHSGIGLHGPIGWEAYAMVGASVPIGQNVLERNLLTGWDATVGARSLFFNPDATDAWVVDLGVTNIYQTAKNRKDFVHVHNMGKQVFDNNFNPFTDDIKAYGKYTGGLGVKYINRTSGNLSLGKEWWLWGSAQDPDVGNNFRVGADVGGRWGSMKMDANAHVTYQTAIFGSLFGAIHADLEIPVSGFILLQGFRIELDNCWNQVLQDTNNANILSLNFLYRFGIRF